MRTKLLNSQGEKTFALIFDKGDEVIGGLTDFARREGVLAAHFTAIGAFSSATLGYFDRERKDYKRIPIDEQVEVLALVGNIAIVKDTGEPKVHAHDVVGTADGAARGGHILEARVWPTLEVVVVEEPEYLRRTDDPETGLALLNAPASS
jgi:predicted DNA-binding protein with PD1-like motif